MSRYGTRQSSQSCSARWVSRMRTFFGNVAYLAYTLREERKSNGSVESIGTCFIVHAALSFARHLRRRISSYNLSIRNAPPQHASPFALLRSRTTFWGVLLFRQRHASGWRDERSEHAG